MQARYYDPVSFLEHLNGEQGVQGFNRYAYLNSNPCSVRIASLNLILV